MKCKQMVAGENGWTVWIQPRRKNYHMQCCDCGLVHVMEFRLVKTRDGRGYIQFRARRAKS